MSCTWDLEENLCQAEKLVRSAAESGANVVLLQELFCTPYFCKTEDPRFFALASEVDDSPLLQRFSSLARELSVVLPISFFERAGNSYFNSIAIVDTDGTRLGTYRKSHIPTGPGYQEKYYFSPGDTGFRVWDTRCGRLGIAICWDQWFPECARAMALLGAEILLYPTAIGSEPQDPSLDTLAQWQATMQGHSAANMTPVVASNRIGLEIEGECQVTFYGHSFITNEVGAKVAEAEGANSEVILAHFDLDAIRESRASFGLFRDRRPDLYDVLKTYDGEHR
jgi:N-carbamoylputrescine amidase